MTKFLRLVAGVVLVAVPLVSDASPARANHGVGTTEQPCPAGMESDDCWHEAMPHIAVAAPSDPCVVTGTVDPGNPYSYKPHNPSVPFVSDDPAHSHFAFIDSIINCPLSDGALGVTAEGGNDGHMINLFCGVVLCPGFPVEVPNDPGRQHQGNEHHGAVGESSWSHSSLYSGGRQPGQSNVCDDNANNQNKADIVVNGFPGWVKYIRVGVAVYAWGCVPGLAPFQVFSAALSILPNVLPTSVPGVYPGGLLNPICPLEFLNHPPFSPPGPGTPASPCGFVLAGVAWRGSDWVPPLTAET